MFVSSASLMGASAEQASHWGISENTTDCTTANKVSDRTASDDLSDSTSTDDVSDGTSTEDTSDNTSDSSTAEDLADTTTVEEINVEECASSLATDVDQWFFTLSWVVWNFW